MGRGSAVDTHTHDRHFFANVSKVEIALTAVSQVCVWTQLAGAGLTAPGNLEANLALPNSLLNFSHTRTNSAVLGTGSFVPTWGKKVLLPLSVCLHRHCYRRPGGRSKHEVGGQVKTGERLHRRCLQLCGRRGGVVVVRHNSTIVSFFCCCSFSRGVESQDSTHISQVVISLLICFC